LAILCVPAVGLSIGEGQAKVLVYAGPRNDKDEPVGGKVVLRMKVQAHQDAVVKQAEAEALAEKKAQQEKEMKAYEKSMTKEFEKNGLAKAAQGLDKVHAAETASQKESDAQTKGVEMTKVDTVDGEKTTKERDQAAAEKAVAHTAAEQKATRQAEKTAAENVAAEKALAAKKLTENVQAEKENVTEVDTEKGAMQNVTKHAESRIIERAATETVSKEKVAARSVAEDKVRKGTSEKASRDETEPVVAQAKVPTDGARPAKASVAVKEQKSDAARNALPLLLVILSVSFFAI